MERATRFTCAANQPLFWRLMLHKSGGGLFVSALLPETDRVLGWFTVTYRVLRHAVQNELRGRKRSEGCEAEETFAKNALRAGFTAGGFPLLIYSDLFTVTRIVTFKLKSCLSLWDTWVGERLFWKSHRFDLLFAHPPSAGDLWMFFDFGFSFWLWISNFRWVSVVPVGGNLLGFLEFVNSWFRLR